MRRCLVFAAAVLAACAGAARAEVTGIDVTTRTDVGSSGYEKIAGTVHFAVDPADPHNRVIVDLGKAPRNAAGRVEFTSDFYVLRPKTGGNGALLLDVLNRGGKPALSGFDRFRTNDPSTDADLGDRFLMRQGFAIAWVGWEFDVGDRPGLLRMYAPIALEGGRPVGGVVRATFTPGAATKTIAVGDLLRYDASDPDGPDSTLTVRSAMLAGDARPVPRSRWHVSGHTVTLDDGFVPGKTYEVAYRTAAEPISGLGLAATRDFVTWLKGDPRSIAPVHYAYAFGSSQSGRFLRDFLYEGFNTDERERQVFDGVMAHIAGASRISLNEHWARPTSLSVYSATAYPFADAALRDPISGAREGLLDNPRAHAHQPKVFYTNTPVEYWGTGRVAALIHATPDGTADRTPPGNVRVYFIAGTQHAPGPFPPTIAAGQQPDNPVDYWWTMRALLVAMHQWVSQGTPPPPSAYPRLADRTLVKAPDLAWPAIPGVASPRALTAGARVANPLLPGGAGGGTPLPLLVPQVDRDGNELAGIRLPDVAVPLATYTGWNFRNPRTGGTGDLVSLLGSSIPFPPTRAARAAASDPRPSVEERYPSREAYLALVRRAADALVAGRYLLADDVARVMARAGEEWDLATRPAATSSDSKR